MVCAYSLPSSTEDHQLPSTKLLDGEDGDPAGDEILGTVKCSEQSASEATETNVVLKDRCGVVCDDLISCQRSFAMLQ